MNPIEELVVGDTQEIVSVLTDRVTGQPVDLSHAETSIKLKVRKVDATELKGEVAYTKLTGLVKKNGAIDTTSPYDVAGKGGRCLASCPVDLFDEAGDYEAEIEVTFGAADQVRTVFELQRFTVRDQF